MTFQSSSHAYATDDRPARGLKAVILAGGLGTRLAEETGVKPKPMVEIGGAPILWHIMKIFHAYGVDDFVICCGYKGDLIREYFANYRIRRSDLTFDFANDDLIIHRSKCEPWRVTLVDTGWNTMTGGRLKRAASHIGDETFFMTYGDGVSDVDLGALLAFHREQGVHATLTAVQPPGRFGAFSLHDDQTRIDTFREKPQGDGDNAWINGGFFVLEPEVLQHIEGDSTVWEREPMMRLADSGNLAAYRHHGFWQPMDTLRDHTYLQELWKSKDAPWNVWQKRGPTAAEPTEGAAAVPTSPVARPVGQVAR